MTYALTDEERNAFKAIVTTAQQIVDSPCAILTTELDTAAFDTLIEKTHESLPKDIDHRDVLINELKAVGLELDKKLKERNDPPSKLDIVD
jgi:hypothetical protein